MNGLGRKKTANAPTLISMDWTVAGIIHEIKRPLHTICNYANACKRALELGDPASVAKAQKWTKLISEETIRVDNIIEGLRDFACTPPRGRRAFDLNKLVRETVESLSNETDHHRVTIRLKLAERLPEVLGNSIQIRQVLCNLLGNASEAMHDRTTIGRSPVTITTSFEDGQVEVAVADVGMGLPSGREAQVFDPFFTTKAGGTGMGLAISHRLIAAHGGRLWATSNPNCGTTFHFTLPVAPRNQEKGLEGATATPSQAGHTVSRQRYRRLPRRPGRINHQ